MPKRKDLTKDEAEIGRAIGNMERAGYGELVDQVRQLAIEEGKNPAQKFAEVIKAGLGYEKYSNLTLADAMKCLDWIERVFANILFPIMQMTGDFSLYNAMEKIKAIAESMGYVRKESIEQVIEDKIKEAYEQGKKDAYKELEEKTSEGPVTKFVKTLSETIAKKIGEKTIEKLADSGLLDEVVNKVADLAGEITKQTVPEVVENEREG